MFSLTVRLQQTLLFLQITYKTQFVVNKLTVKRRPKEAKSFGAPIKATKKAEHFELILLEKQRNTSFWSHCQCTKVKFLSWAKETKSAQTYLASL